MAATEIFQTTRCSLPMAYPFPPPGREDKLTANSFSRDSIGAPQPLPLHQLKTEYAEVKIIAYEPALRPPTAAKWQALAGMMQPRNT